MRQPLSCISSFAALILAVSIPHTATAVVPSDQLMPATTTGYVSIADVDRLRVDFDKTQLGQLMADPIMKPFADDLKRQIEVGSLDHRSPDDVR